MKYADLDKKTVVDLNKMLAELRSRQQEVTFKLAANQVKDVREIREIKRDIARILTKLNAMDKAEASSTN